MPTRLFDLSGKNAIVTGAASGLGRAIAIGLAEAGANVLCGDINLAGAQETSRIIQQKGPKSFAVEVDVTSEDEVAEMVRRARQSFSRVDISFNVPGINIRKPALEYSLEEYRRVIEINQIAVFICAQAVGRVMVEQRSGSMVNISSIMGHIVRPGQAGYSSAKGAVSQLTKVLAVEWAPYNVRVNALCPGFTKTPLIQPLLETPGWENGIVERTPMGRLAEPEDMVGPAIFLASDASGYVTGETLFVDGGWMAL